VIVIFALRDDRHACRVAELLGTRHGDTVHIVDMSRFPGHAALSVRFDGGLSSCRLREEDAGEIDLLDVKSFWWRRPQAPPADPRITDPTIQSFAQNESMSALYGVLGLLPGLWMNDIGRDQNADFKPRQLAMAMACGLRVPDTLISNNPAEVRAFHARHDGAVVFKSFNQRGILWQPTKRLRPEDLRHLDTLALAPVIFQREVAGHRDIRVTVVGETVFATEFDISSLDLVDHRLALGTAPCIPHILPPGLEAQVRGFVRAFGLEYGSVDFRIDPDGAYHFFEINTAGEFLYLQDRSGQPIDAAVAAHLATGAPTSAARPVSRQAAAP
jgi:hypothetical protein